jgi:hypothetical protein
MDKPIKISVCGNQGLSVCGNQGLSVCGKESPLTIVNDSLIHSLKKINLFEVVNSPDLNQSDIIYWISGNGPSIKKYFLFWIKKNPIIIIHWIGTDVLGEIQKSQQHGIRRIENFIMDCVFWWKMKRGGLIHLAVAPWLVDELSALHIPATCLPITTIDIRKLGTVDSQVVKDIDFLSYVPFKRFDFYGGDKIVQLARRWQNYQFLIICADLTEIPPDLVEKMPENVTLFPRVAWNNMPEFYQRSKFFIRYTNHDGLSLSVLEALYFNLEVFWTYDFPCTHKIETLEKLSDSIPSLVKNWHPNERGHAYVIEHFSIEKWREDFLAIIKSKLPDPQGG